MSVLPPAGILTWLQDAYLLTQAVHEWNQRSGVSKTTTRKTSSISEFHTTIMMMMMMIMMVILF